MMSWDTPARAEARRRIRAGEGFLYVIAFTLQGEDLIKLGFSLHPQRRARGLGFMAGRLLATMPGSVLNEKAIHRALLPIRRQNRWWPSECYPRSILSHPAIPAELRAEQPQDAA